MTSLAFHAIENPFGRLDKAIQQHVAKLPHYLQTEVYDFVLFLEQKQRSNVETLKLSLEQQQTFVQALATPKSANAKL